MATRSCSTPADNRSPNDAGRVTTITHKNASNTTIDSYSYALDAANRVTQETSTLGPTRNYTYDATGQLTGDGTSTFTFDLNGNRTMSGYTTNTGNQLTSDGTWNYTYDYEGNVVMKACDLEVWRYTYNEANQLTKVEHKPDAESDIVDHRITFKYDVLGNRIELDDDADGDGSGTATVTRFAYDLNGNAWADLNGSSSLTTRRLYLDAVDALFARIDGSGNTAWYLDDHLGSVRDLMNNSGSIIDHIDYSAFGAVSYESSSSNGDRYKFTSREFDIELSGASLAYYRGRYYRFDVGMWQSQDPLRFGAGDSNLYRYVGNEAANATDPTGLDGQGMQAQLNAAASNYAQQLGYAGPVPVFQLTDTRQVNNGRSYAEQFGYTGPVPDASHLRWMMGGPARQRMSVGQWFSWYFSPIPRYVMTNPGDAFRNFVIGGNRGARDV